MSRTYRLVSKPHGAARLAIGYLIGRMPELEAALAHALPGQAIVCTDDGSPAWTSDDLRQAATLASLPTSAPLVLFGWSAGCQPVRSALMSRSVDSQLEGVALFDGTHSSYPRPAAAHLEAYRRLFARAEAGEVSTIATCTSMGYVERLTPPDGPFASTRHVLEACLSPEFKPGDSLEGFKPSVSLEPGAPLVRGRLYVERYASGDIDGPAHIRQVREVAPRLLGSLIGADHAPGLSEDPDGGWWGSRLSALVQAGLESIGNLGRSAGHGSGWRCVEWCEREMSAGVREEPPGSNDSPRIREYFTKPDYRRAGQPLHVSRVAWCAAAQSMAHHECGIDVPAFVSGVEFETWAKAAGRLEGKDYLPRAGDLAIFHRPGVGWERHVTRVRKDAEEGKPYETIAGNEAGDTWRVSEHPAAPSDPAFSSFVRI